MTPAWRTATRRGVVPVVLGILCIVASVPAIEDLDPLLKGLGAILVVLGLIVTVATGRNLSAQESRIGPPV